MTTIELPSDVAQELLFAANSKNKTVSDYIVFLMGGEYHPVKNLPEGEYHPAAQMPPAAPGHNDAESHNQQS
ncbi:MAG: hypothetical protein FWG50_09495 [Kiritimatiellaeota bacterium]|nr:hypothetical protein [Kiritimatiellota bacterium]